MDQSRGYVLTFDGRCCIGARQSALGSVPLHSAIRPTTFLRCPLSDKSWLLCHTNVLESEERGFCVLFRASSSPSFSLVMFLSCILSHERLDGLFPASVSSHHHHHHHHLLPPPSQTVRDLLSPSGPRMRYRGVPPMKFSTSVFPFSTLSLQLIYIIV